VIHRDLKPENIVIVDYEDLTSVKLIDFGLSIKSTKANIHDYAKCGTLLYTPPEQVLNNFAYAKVIPHSSSSVYILCLESRYVGSWHHCLYANLWQTSSG
jgi:serine/threonine protein kinase